MAKTKRVGILTAGGDSPGLNAAIRAVGKAALGYYGMEFIGFRDGFRGLAEDRRMRLDKTTLAGILTVGGTILGTSRDKPHRMEIDGRVRDMTSAIVKTYERNHLDAVVCLGGGGTQKNALRLVELGLRVVTLPKTIDNDVALTDATFGFDTALGIATEAIDRLHSTAHSHHRIVVAEIMGHQAGWLTLGAGIAGGADLDTLALTTQVALALNDRGEFESAYQLLAQKYPNEMPTHFAGAIEAAMGEHWLRAESEIKKAEKLGLDHQSAQRFLASGIHSHAVWSRIELDTALTIGFWAAGLFLLFALGFLLSKVTLRQAGQADTLATVTAGERTVRKLYRVVLNVAGVYYYISLPIVLVLVVGVVAVALYACLMIGRIPIKLMLILGIGALFTIVAMIKSLLIRVQSADPGRPLQRAEAPGLWELAEEVAQSVGTRPVDEIRITPGTELAVYERGTWREKMRNQAKRVLLLGAGVLNGFKQNDFRCVLAHEYGHFSHRDTAGGDIALRVRMDIMKFYYAMRAAGQATYINAAFHFLRIYNFIFRRISHGATRLQEILADRVAAQIYGAPAFEGGLTHVIRRSIEFEAAANGEIKQSIEASRPLQNLYELPAPEATKVAAEFEKSLNRPTTEDDTHPGPRDRFRLVARFQQPTCSPRPGEVWELFKDPAALRAEMVAEIEKNVAPHRGKGDSTDASAETTS